MDCFTTTTYYYKDTVDAMCDNNGLLSVSAVL